MITLRQHIKYTDIIKSGTIEDLGLKEKLELIRGVEETYPLKMDKGISKYIKDNFVFYDNVFDMVLGQFIMVEQILTGKFKFKSEVDLDIELSKYLFRPKNELEFDNEDPTKEHHVRESILDTPVQDFYNALNFFLEKREYVLFKQFAGVFYDSSKNEEEEEQDSESQSYGEDTDAEFNQQWYWYSIVRTLAQEDIRRYSEVYMLKMSVVLPEMSYLSQKNKVEAAQQRAQAALNRL
jgi:hypothetical protein